METIARKLGVKYVWHGDYLVPDLQPEEDRPLGKYGRMRRIYLQEHEPVQFELMLLSGKLTAHLREIDDTAHERIERMIAETLKRDPAPDKATDQMGWVRHMNSLKASAEEVVLAEFVYS